MYVRAVTFMSVMQYCSLGERALMVVQSVTLGLKGQPHLHHAHYRCSPQTISLLNICTSYFLHILLAITTAGGGGETRPRDNTCTVSQTDMYPLFILTFLHGAGLTDSLLCLLFIALLWTIPNSCQTEPHSPPQQTFDHLPTFYALCLKWLLLHPNLRYLLCH